ncbi:hypothetical protein J2Z69_001781 [Paenibacillus shirakamiensis]|uniref:CD-NTase-associated protein 12/Pycsar effector protein TIR domain-containing protein n=2 Tax=Paenibacillus shirakamiensis TaxID=1265935 RepID=A0ABS4JGB1_9BACL|nr:hypothetical protein [Paenibacillus shirakamiensis]
MTKPTVFIGSSREAIPIVNAVQEELQHDAVVTPWHRGVFQAGRYTMEDLEQQVYGSDFAVFVFHVDDVTRLRGKLYYTTRDNTVFEMGLFWSRLGRERVFFIIPADIQEASEHQETVEGFRTPTDLLGLTTLTYQMYPNNWNAAVGVACGKISGVMQELGPKDTDVKEKLLHWEEERESFIRIIGFFEELNRKTLFDTHRYNSLCRALRLSFVASPYMISGSALFLANHDQITQVGSDGIGDVGRQYPMHGNHAAQDIIHVVDVHLSGNVSFSQHKRKSIVKEYILCYPLAKDYVFTIHLKGTMQVTEELFDSICKVNKTLLDSIHDLLGGDST